MASQVLQVPGLHKAAGLYHWLRWTRQGRILSNMLRQEVGTPRIRLRLWCRIPANRWSDVSICELSGPKCRLLYLPTLFTCAVRMKSPQSGHSTIPIRLRSWRRKDRAARDAVVQCLLPNSSWPREPCGTKSASTVPSVIVPLILLWLATDPIMRSIAAPATESSSDPRDSVMATPPPWSPLAESPQFLSRFIIVCNL